MMDAFAHVVLSLGSAGENERLLAGTIVFGGVVLLVGYFILFRDDVELGLTIKILTAIMFVLMVLSYFWPQRPWPH